MTSRIVIIPTRRAHSNHAEVPRSIGVDIIAGRYAEGTRLPGDAEMIALTSVGLPTKLRNTPAELSGGQQQRVAIARAIVTEPGTLFADEPTGNLDTATTREVMNLLVRLNSEHGITVILVTHEDDVAAYAKRVIHVRDGLIFSDSSNPQTPALR